MPGHNESVIIIRIFIGGWLQGVDLGHKEGQALRIHFFLAYELQEILMNVPLFIDWAFASVTASIHRFIEF